MIRDPKQQGSARTIAVSAALLISAFCGYVLIERRAQSGFPDLRTEDQPTILQDPGLPHYSDEGEPPVDSMDGRRSPVQEFRSGDGQESDLRIGDVDSALAEIRDLQAQGILQPAPYERALRRILENGGEHGLRTVLKLMTSEDLEFWGEAGVFQRVLAPLDSPEIADAAETALEQRLIRGETGTAQIDGYLKLLVAKGNRGAVFDRVLEVADQNPVGTVVTSVLDSLKTLELSPSETGRLFEKARQYAGLEADVYEAVIDGGGEYGAQLVEDLILSPEAPNAAQLSLAIGKAFTVQKVRDLVVRMPGTPQGDRSVLDVLSAAGPRIEADTSGAILDRGRSAIRRALVSDSPEFVKSALFALRDLKTLASEEFLVTIRANINSWDPEVQIVGRRLLAASGRS